MRNSTVILVVLILVGATLAERKVRSHHATSCRFDRCESRDWTRTTVRHPELKRIQTAVRDIDRRLSDTEAAVKTIARSERSIESLIRQAKRDRSHAMRHDADQTVSKIYAQNLSDLETQLGGLRKEKATLVAHRDNLKAKKIQLQADFELTKIAVRNPSYEKPSPLESIEDEASAATIVNVKKAPGAIEFE